LANAVIAAMEPAASLSKFTGSAPATKATTTVEMSVRPKGIVFSPLARRPNRRRSLDEVNAEIGIEYLLIAQWGPISLKNWTFGHTLRDLGP